MSHSCHWQPPAFIAMAPRFCYPTAGGGWQLSAPSWRGGSWHWGAAAPAARPSPPACPTTTCTTKAAIHSSHRWERSSRRRASEAALKGTAGAPATRDHSCISDQRTAARRLGTQQRQTTVARTCRQAARASGAMALVMKQMASAGIVQQLLPAAGALLPGLGAVASQLQARRTKMSHSEASACVGCRRGARVAIAAMP